MRYPFVSRLLEELAPELGIVLELEPEYQFAGELIFVDGRRMVFRNFNINSAAASETARDKSYTNYFLRKHGFHVPEGKTFFSPRLNLNLPPSRRRGVDEACHYAQSLGLPVFIKPNDLSQGEGVAKIYSVDELPPLAHAILARSDVMLLENACSGRDYRVVVLDDQIIAAYERRPLAVTGDGQHSIEQLLHTLQTDLAHSQRLNSAINLFDPRIDIKLNAQGLTRRSVLAKGLEVALLDNANLSTGGSTIDVSEEIHPSFAAMAIAATRCLGLRLAGVDVLCEDLCSDARGQSWHIIELNAAPGLDNFAALGDAQMARVRGLYRRLLKELAAGA
jgi:D-alanine-D-alanine ligase-like ATP-grasp enzyme